MAVDTPENLYKYCSYEEALEILQTKSLRWQSPSLLSEAFTLSHESNLTFDRDAFLKSAIKVAISLIFGRDDPKGETPLLAAIRRWRGEQRFNTPDEAQGILKELLGKMVDHKMDELAVIVADWQKYCASERVCSFAEKPDQLDNWIHHGHNGRAVVLRFLVGEDRSLKEPEPISYLPVKPEITSIKEQMACLFYNHKDKSRESFKARSLMKPPVFKQEKEWRCFRKTANPPSLSESEASEWHESFAFDPKDLKAVYFGPELEPEAVDTLSTALKANFEKSKRHQLSFSKGTYALAVENLEY
ncbi:MAG: hypothetical protein ACI93R_002362 [Flavobacteriales bacterium]